MDCGKKKMRTRTARAVMMPIRNAEKYLAPSYVPKELKPSFYLKLLTQNPSEVLKPKSRITRG